VNWEALANLDGTLVILMGMMTRAEIAEALQRGGKPGSTPTAVIERGTTADQTVVRTTLDRLAEVSLGSPSVIVVGPVAALGADGATPMPVWPLSGRTVVLTRPGPRGRSLIEALHRLGAATIEVPLTEQAGPRDGGTALRIAAHDVRLFRWIVFTSANAVSRFMAELRDARALGGTLVAAVGPATADALREQGVEPDLVPVQHMAEGLIAEFPEAESPEAESPEAESPEAESPEAESRAATSPEPAPVAAGNRVLFPCADLAPSTLPEALGRKGWDVERVEAYQTVTLPPPDEALLSASARADAVVFAAGSAAKAYADLKGPDGAPLRVPPLVMCVGPSTAERARSLGMSGVEEAGDPSTEGVVAALVRNLTVPDSP
jgi:uroporphyrinogen III methyltransferase/synthase